MTASNAQDQRQRRTLLLVLALNFGLFLALGVAGWLADSSALLANAADNASDSAVYLISFLAVGRAPRWKKTAATMSGVLLLLFAIGVLADVGRRWLMGTEPIGPTMMVMALAAALVVAISLSAAGCAKKAPAPLPAPSDVAGRSRSK